MSLVERKSRKRGREVSRETRESQETQRIWRPEGTKQHKTNRREGVTGSEPGRQETGSGMNMKRYRMRGKRMLQ